MIELCSLYLSVRCIWPYVLVMSRTRFQIESTLYTGLIVKELLALSRREIWRWSDCNWTRTQNHLVLKRTLNHLDLRTKWLSVVLSTDLYGAFDCMFWSCHVRIFRVNSHSLVAWLSRNSLLEAGAESEGKVTTATGLEHRTTSFLNEHSTIWVNCPNDWGVFRVLICTVHLNVCSCHIRYAFSEWTNTLWLPDSQGTPSS